MSCFAFLTPEDKAKFVARYLAHAIEDHIQEYDNVEILWLNQYIDGEVRVYISYVNIEGREGNDNIYCRFHITDEGMIEDFVEVES